MTKRPSVQKGDELISQLESTLSEDELGEVANRLLEEFHQGYPLSKLKPLFRSHKDAVVRAAAFVASELGAMGKPLLRDVANLLSHPTAAVRFDAIDSILTCATVNDGDVIAAVVRLLEDSDSGVRWKALDFLARSSQEQLRAALQHFRRTQPSSTHVNCLTWLLSTEGTSDRSILSHLRESTAPMSVYAVAAAARIASKNAELLRQARSAKEPYVRRFVEFALKRFESR